MRHCGKSSEMSRLICHVRTSSALIELWSRMYEEKAPWLHNTDNANIPATIAGEIARLTTLELQSKVEGSPRAECMDAVYRQVLGKLRVQTEYAFAKGSMVFKPYITPDGAIAIQYIQADMFFPLDFDSEKTDALRIFGSVSEGQ